MTEKKSKESLIEGMIISLFADEGPEILYNSSPFDESDAFSMVVKNLTAIGTDTPRAFGEIEVYGPLPSPSPNHTVMAFLFSIKAEKSTDPRIVQFGRMGVIWTVSNSNIALKYSGILKRILRRLFDFYHITTDADFMKNEIFQKFDDKLRINISGGVQSYYISTDSTLEPVYEIEYVPPNVPIILIDIETKDIKILIQDEISAIKKNQYRQMLNDLIKETYSGISFKYEWVSDPITVKMQLSKLGFDTKSVIREDFEVRFFGELNLNKIDTFFASKLEPQRKKLSHYLYKSIESQRPEEISNIALETGFSPELISHLIDTAIKSGLFQGGRNENGIFYPPEKLI